MSDHESILDRWEAALDPDGEQHRSRGFIRDGILDVDRWNKARRKVLFLLKEAYNRKSPNRGYDLRELIRKELLFGDKRKRARDSTWWRVAEWAYLVQESTSDGVARLPKEKRSEKAGQALLGCAWVNVKKSNGKEKSKSKDIARYASHDAEFLREQIKTIGPQIIVCCNTWSAVREVLWEKAELKDPYDWVRRAGDVFIVNFVHPNRAERMTAHTLASLLRHAGAFG